MEEDPNDSSPLLQLIPRNRMSSRQKALLLAENDGDSSPPLYGFLGEPTDLQQMQCKNFLGSCIWRENGSIIYFNNHHCEPFLERYLLLLLSNHDQKDHLYCAVYGETDAAIAETATFFLSLPDAWHTYFTIYSLDNSFDFGALQLPQLIRILKSNPQRRIRLFGGTFSEDQAVILASRPHCLHLELGREFSFHDGGMAFVSALGNRTTSFGTLVLMYERHGYPFNNFPLNRFFELQNAFDKLEICGISPGCAMLPLVTHVNTLVYRVHAQLLPPDDFEDLEIDPKDITLQLFLDDGDDWHEIVIAFLKQVAAAGHVERLCLSLSGDRSLQLDHDEAAPVAKALILCIKRNPKLRCLDLSETAQLIDWRPHLQGIFEVLETHTSLRKFVVKDRTWKQLHYTWLAQLLTRNCNITVLNDKGRMCSNGSTIDKIYAERRNASTSQPGINDPPGSSSLEAQPTKPRKRKTRMH
ncbi:hypothetical protein FisN_10Lu415 [Fistulifera solaris]|uniref:Uncharacterized protein n=1 Tax=Fistulifera solaris TaxID=1519565 RepID=A0A1Z5JUI9_FISSO|nr:hypothetical protein FisN_10Lu415 [Fistulifera solaris]|eukprot:GAX17697.1 hypothetical protein FisN_10Lu415 [Fistulifera solaris]